MAEKTSFYGPQNAIDVVRVGREYAVVNADTGEVYGHRTYAVERDATHAAVALLNAQYPDEDEVA